ncbi:response regulator transcription factor [Parvibaculum sp.]|uniref:response regulator transcription factor n=1 Tax=Parvibaculum sp. TaxID=2024848 RepID=UPI00272B2ACF|nr:response regulator [Parvibaculum sp.]
MIYIVDDDDAVRDSTRALFEAYGLTVRDYPSANHFLDDDRTRERDGLSCCLLLDLHMPGMSGAELLEHLKESEISLPTVVLTGRADAQLRERVMRAGARALLEKPVNSEDLAQTIRQVLMDHAAD